jgi:hypothetical protein
MKDYLNDVGKEMSVVFKHYRWSLVTLLILCLVPAVWIGYEIEKEESFRSLPLYPALAAVVAVGTFSLVADIYARILRRKGVL